MSETGEAGMYGSGAAGVRGTATTEVGREGGEMWKGHVRQECTVWGQYGIDVCRVWIAVSLYACGSSVAALGYVRMS